MARLFKMADSGNCYKVQLTAAHLGLDLDTVEVDIMQGESRTRDFLAMNPNGRVPTLELDDGSYLPESNAIMWYLAQDSRLVPDSRADQARVLQWLFFEQYSHEPYIATVRYWMFLAGEAEQQADEIDKRRPRGYAALDVMETHLEGAPYFVGGAYSIADIGLFAYTHVADEGGFDLARYPNVRAWLDRVRGEPGWIPMERRG